MRNEANIQSIILNLIGKNNKKFVLFSLFMIVCVLSFLYMIVSFFYGGIYGGTNIYKKYDITGYSEPIQIFLIAIMFIIIIISCYFSFRAPKEGVNYYANKIIGIAFIIFAIFPILSFEIIRNKEEGIAIEYQKNLVEKTQSQNKNSSKSKKLSNLYNQLDIEQDKSREMEIANQIKTESSKNEFSSQLINSYDSVK